MNIRFRCPTKPEETGWQAEYGKQSRNEAVFLGPEAVGDDVGLEIEVYVAAVDDDANDAGDDNADKHYT
jgi:hypothetical protein